LGYFFRLRLRLFSQGVEGTRKATVIVRSGSCRYLQSANSENNGKSMNTQGSLQHSAKLALARNACSLPYLFFIPSVDLITKDLDGTVRHPRKSSVGPLSGTFER